MGNKTPTKGVSGKIVVVGGGYAGTVVAAKLEAVGFEVTLIDRKDFFFHNIGALRTCYKEGWENTICIPYTSLLKREGAVVHGEVVEIDVEGKTVHALLGEGDDNRNKQEFAFDYLVICTGAPIPVSFPARIPPGENKVDFVKRLTEFRNGLRDANNIVLIGGGPVGIELAGELRDGYPDKKITIIHSGATLLSNSIPALKPETTARALQKLEQHNITVVLKKKVDLSCFDEGKNFVSGSTKLKVIGEEGTDYDADFVINCIGNASVNPDGKPDSPFPKGWTDDKGQVKVNKFLQVEVVKDGHIFALGDITNLNETKLAFYVKAHADVVFHNICCVASKKTDLKHEYPGQDKANIFLPVGATDGLAELGGKLLPNFMGKKLVVAAKGKSLLVESSYKDLNVKPPKLS